VLRWTAIIVVVAVTRRRTTAAIAIEATFTTGAIIAGPRTAFAARWAIGATEEAAATLAIAWWWTIGTIEATTGTFGITSAWAIRAGTRTIKMAFEATFKMALEVTARRTGWAWWRRGWHVLVDELGKFLELVFA
jgi:hypothetical protein